MLDKLSIANLWMENIASGIQFWKIVILIMSHIDGSTLDAYLFKISGIEQEHHTLKPHIGRPKKNLIREIFFLQFDSSTLSSFSDKSPATLL